MIHIYFLWWFYPTFIEDRKGKEKNANQNWTIERGGKNIIILGGLLVWHGVPNNRMAKVPGLFLFCNE